MHLKEIDEYILASLKKTKGERSNIDGVQRKIEEAGKEWSYQYIVKRLNVLNEAGLVEKPTRGMYNLTDEGKKHLSDSMETMETMEKAKADKAKETRVKMHADTSGVSRSEQRVIDSLSNLDKIILSILRRPGKAEQDGWQVQEIKKEVNRDRENNHHATSVQRRLRLLHERGFTRKINRGIYTITEEGQYIFKLMQGTHRLPNQAQKKMQEDTP